MAIDLTTQSYVTTVAAGDTYFEGRMESDPWDDATDADQGKALVHATRIIDRLNFKGEKTEDDQDLQFPRYADDDVPQDVQDACCEIAFALLDGIDPDLEYENLRMVSQGIGNIRSTYNPEAIPEHILAGVPSAAAWRYLKPYLRDVRDIRVSRV